MNLPFFFNEENRKETWLLLVAFVALCIEVLALLYQLRLVSLPGLRSGNDSQERAIGAVTFREKNVTSRAPSSLSWYPLAGGDKVHLNDSVMTGSGARVRIELEGATELVLEGDTLIRFSDERKWNGGSSVVNLEVNQGIVRVKSEKAPIRVAVRNRRIDVGPGSEVLLEKSAVRAEAQVQVAKGKAVVLEGAEEGQGVTIKEGDRVSLPEAVGAIAPPLPAVLKLAARTPASGAKLFAKTEVEEVLLSWDGADGDTLEWDRSDDFKNVKTQAAAGETRLGLKPGRYHWRVRRGTRVSEPTEFVLVPPIHYEVRGPASNSVLKRNQKLKLDWAAVDGANEYRLEVAADENFASVTVDKKGKATAVELGQLPPGKYFWRVTASSKDWGPWPASAVKSFSIKKPLAAPKAKGPKMLKGGWLRSLSGAVAVLWNWIIPEAQAAEGADSEEVVLAWQFSWEKIEGAAGYRVEVGLDPNFKKLAIKREVTETTISLQLPPGRKYYWRVAAFDEDKELGAYSRTEKVDAPNGRIQKIPVRLPAYVKQEPPKPPVPPRSEGLGYLVPSWVRLGAGGGFVMQSVSASNASIQSTGFPLGKFDLYLHRTFAGSELELGVGFQKLRYQTKDGAIAAFQPDILTTNWDGHLLYKGLGWLGGSPLTVGFAYRTLSDLHRVGDETASMVHATSASVLVGVSPWQSSDSSTFRQADLLLEASPLGSATGFGLWLRGRFGLWNLAKPLTAELQLLLHPSYRKFGSGARSQLGLETAVALVIGGLFDVSPKWVE